MEMKEIRPNHEEDWKIQKRLHEACNTVCSEKGKLLCNDSEGEERRW